MLEVKDLYKTYDNQPLLKGVSFTVAAGETICLLGSSGSGKSTILRIIAGLETPESGEVRWKGTNLENVATHQRNFGLMFQDYALFPHLDVFENVAFGLRMQNGSPQNIRTRVHEVLSQANLPGFSRRRVTELSGGEQQRVALARALAPHPRLLMLDEPLGALDRALRENLIEELRGILHRSGIPAIYVTHDQQEAFTIADTILLLHEGRVVQAGSAPEVFAHPANAWVARFLGLGNLLDGVQTENGVETSLGNFPIEPSRPTGEKVTLLMRPQAELVSSGETITGIVTDVVFRGQDFRVEINQQMVFHLAQAPQTGSEIKLKILKMEAL
jgi:ABC-type Fe3+/spermidine/putrescine transport system ATPase subunit